MKTPSFKSLASMLLAGALVSAPHRLWTGRGGGRRHTEQSGALMRVATSVDVEAATIASTTTVKSIKTVTATDRDADAGTARARRPTTNATTRGASFSATPVA